MFRSLQFATLLLFFSHCGLIHSTATSWLNFSRCLYYDQSLNNRSPHDKSFFSSLANSPIKHLFIYMRGETFLKDFDLYECSCYGTGAHNRFARGNSRTKVENLIVDHVSKHSMDSIRILSLGAAGCLQDLILAAKLAEVGLQSIHLTLVDTPFRDKCYQDLVRFLKELEKAYDITITSNKFASIMEIDAREKFNLVYAIDYEDYSCYRDYSSRKLPGRTGYFSERPYRAAIDLIKAASLATSPNALAVMSHGTDIVSLTPNTAESYSVEFKPLSQLYYDLELFDSFYLNADISNLSFNLDLFSRLKKPLLINKDIVSENDRDSVTALLNHLEVPHEFVDDATVLARFGQEHQKQKCLVVDYTVFDARKGETPIPQRYQSPNFSIVRIDFSWVGRRKGCFPIDIYPSRFTLQSITKEIRRALSYYAIL